MLDFADFIMIFFPNKTTRTMIRREVADKCSKTKAYLDEKEKMEHYQVYGQGFKH